MKQDKLASIFIMLLIALLFAGKFLFLNQLPVNQDEFQFLSLVHEHLNGRLTDTFQTFHVHFFTWISNAGADEIEQVFAGRKILTILLAATCWFFYLSWRTIVSRPAALFSIFCHIGLFFTFFNSAGLRCDTLALFFYAVCIYCLLAHHDKIAGCLIGGGCMAAAILITIKSVVFLPGAFIILILRPLSHGAFFKKTLICLSTFLFALCITGAGLYHLHSKMLAQPAVSVSKPLDSINTSDRAKDFGQKSKLSVSNFFSFQNLFPRWDTFKTSFKIDWMIWMLLLAGGFLSAWESVKGIDRFRHLSILILAAPMLSFLVYRNAHAYYYAFVMPGAMLLAGSLLDRLSLTDIRLHVRTAVTGIICALIFFNVSTLGFAVYSTQKNVAQQQTLDIIHEIFPEPVTYIDGCSMVATFPKVGFFMSSAGMRSYLHRAKPVFKNIIENSKPQFLLANVPHLELSASHPPYSSEGYRLLKTDWDILKSNYVHHWGKIWIAGLQIDFDTPMQQKIFSILIPGFYTVTSEANVIIDNIMHEKNTAFYLAKGSHEIKLNGFSRHVVLKYGKHPFLPDRKPVSAGLFTGTFL